MKVKCVKCGKRGSLTMKSTITKGKHYRYFYVEHSEKRRKSWCFIGKELPKEYKRTESKGYTKDTQSDTQTKNPKSLVFQQNGASGGIRTRDPRLTKAEPHRARLPRRVRVYYLGSCFLCFKRS